jgi:uncharacterized heparinase superfamily protein
LVAADTFRFFEAERRCATAADWHPSDATRLWRYHLHYFDDLNSADDEARAYWQQSLLERWVRENPPGQGEGWEPYPLSRRLVNWVKWATRGHLLPAACHESLAVQARWLTDSLEYHLLGNHLLANATALVHAGLYFEGPEAERWYRRGLAILARELREQVLADGGHFELSTMYHARVLEDVLDLINLLVAHTRYVPNDWHELAALMRRWLLVMSHPDGQIAFFNDAAFGMAATPAEIEAYAARLGLTPPAISDEPLTVLAASGYVKATAGPAYLLCDCSQIGPTYQPGHAHADTLSFELSLAGRRVLVNSGVSEYGSGIERMRQRGTAAHNTVIVNGENSSEIWGGFRVARRATARLLSATVQPSTTVEACHDGYERLPGQNCHLRRWSLEQHSLRIEDRISGEFDHAEARLHVHPEIDAQVSGAAEVTLRRGDSVLARVQFEGAAAVEVDPGTWHPRFGISVANLCISARFADGALSTQILWPTAP